MRTAPNVPPVSEQVLETLIDRVNIAHMATQTALANALANGLDAGDALLDLQKAHQARGITPGWWRWLEKNCRVPLSTAKLYMRLARHRDEIEAERERVLDLSLRAACRLIKDGGNSPRQKTKAKPKSELVAAWANATDEERTRLLDSVTVRGILGVSSLAFRRELAGRLRKREAEDEPSHRLTMALRAAIGFVKVADDPQTSPAVALSQEKSALSALRGLARMHADFNGLSVGFRQVEDPKHSRKDDRKQRCAA